MVLRSLTEIRIAYEIAELLPLDPEDHRLVLRGRTFDCDMIVRPRQLVMEYHGAYWHKSEDRDRRKVEKLQSLGWRVVRVREQPLHPIKDADVAVPLGAPPKLVVDLLLARLADLGDIAREVARNYQERADLMAGAKSLARIREVQTERARVRTSKGDRGRSSPLSRGGAAPDNIDDGPPAPHRTLRSVRGKGRAPGIRGPMHSGHC